jgi:predicted amidohydrolase YtcJ
MKISPNKAYVSLSLLALATATPVLSQARSASVSSSPDILIINGKVMTPDGWAEAVAIDDGLITKVGTTLVLSKLASSTTKIFDAKGAAVIPGLHDLHVHAIGGGLEQFSCRFRPAAPPAEISKAVAACVRRAKPGEWIQGGNWIANVFAKGQQTAAFLDKVAPNNPVMLSDESHHSAFVNSAALKAAGITRATKDPVNGKIERDAKGEPTGVLREAAMGLVAAVIPPAGEERMTKGLEVASNLMLSYGITSFTDAGLDPVSLKVMSDMSRTGGMKLRVRGCMRWNPNDQGGESTSLAMIAGRQRFETARFKPDCIKVGLDGVPTESHTAAMLEPYHGSNETGMSSIAAAVLHPSIIDFDRQGLHVKFHAAGDAAVRNAINAIAAARKANGPGGPFHDVAHASFVDPADIKRVAELSSSWEFSPYIWYPSTITRDIIAAVGEERMVRWIPIADALNAGGLVGAGSDWSVVPSINPWLAIETMVTRQQPGGSAATLGAGQRVKLADALRIFTLNGARVMRHSDIVGTIEPGKFADIVVTDRDVFSIPETDIHKVHARWTFIAGEKVFDQEAPPPSLEGVLR